ncbi:MAG: DUF3108 domain-containing protein [Woeseiaceae bacterium]|nr:DUF3108 domain-containing protein [Woeseiaceae bacterium]
MKFVAILLLALALSAVIPVYGATELTPHSAEYKVKISIVSGVLNTELRKTPNGYVAHHIVEPSDLSRLITRGKMEITSEFENEIDGIKPVRFRAIDTIRNDPDINLLFDWSANLVKGTVGEKFVELQLNGIAHDTVSIQYELMNNLLTGNIRGQYILFDLDELKIANVSSAGEKLIKTEAGEFMALGIRHQKKGSSQITTLWCAEKLGYLPIVIEQHRKDKLKFQASLVKYTPKKEQ